MPDDGRQKNNFTDFPCAPFRPGEGEAPSVADYIAVSDREKEVHDPAEQNTLSGETDFRSTEYCPAENTCQRKETRHRRPQRGILAFFVLILLCFTGLVGALYLNSTGIVVLKRTDNSLLNAITEDTLQLADRIQERLPGETYHTLKKISNEEEFAAAAQAARDQGYTSIALNLTPAFYASANQHRLAALSGMQSYQAAYIDKTCRFLYEEITWSDRPVISCRNEQELQDAVRSMGKQGVTDFTLVFDPDFFQAVTALDWFSFRQLTGEAGLYAYDCCNYSTDACYITVVGAEIETDIQLLSSIREAFEYAELRALEEPDTIALYCTQNVYALLTDTSGTAEGTGLPYISDLMVDCGILSGSWSMNGTSCVIRLKIDSYYPGFRAANAWRKEDTSDLTDREKQTYDAGLTLAQELQTGDLFSTAMAIHDRLCASVDYYTDQNSESEDDTATGALLSGLANCDGYTDAFYLVGTMAGLTVRYQHGNTYDQAEASSGEANLTHAWNLLLLNDSWVHVDVTWDDRDDDYGWGHNWFAVGDDRMCLTHYWNRNDDVTTASATDLSARPANEYTVSNDAELQAAVQNAVTCGQSQITIFFTNGMGVQVDRTFDLLHRGGRNVDMLYSVDEELNALSVYQIY